MVFTSLVGVKARQPRGFIIYTALRYESNELCLLMICHFRYNFLFFIFVNIDDGCLMGFCLFYRKQKGFSGGRVNNLMVNV